MIQELILLLELSYKKLIFVKLFWKNVQDVGIFRNSNFDKSNFE